MGRLFFFSKKGKEKNKGPEKKGDNDKDKDLFFNIILFFLLKINFITVCFPFPF